MSDMSFASLSPTLLARKGGAKPAPVSFELACANAGAADADFALTRVPASFKGTGTAAPRSPSTPETSGTRRLTRFS